MYNFGFFNDTKILYNHILIILEYYKKLCNKFGNTIITIYILILLFLNLRSIQ